MTYDESLDALNITLGDTDDVTFTPEEKARALQKAWNDSYVVSTLWDTSLTFDSSTYQYTVPTSLASIKDVYINPSNSTADEPTKISSDLWEVVAGKLQFRNGAVSIIPDGYTLYLKGNKKLDWNTDTLDTVGEQEYVIALAGYNTLSLLGYKKANLFLKNDTTVSELINIRRELEREVKALRAKLTREFERA